MFSSKLEKIEDWKKAALYMEDIPNGTLERETASRDHLIELRNNLAQHQLVLRLIENSRIPEIEGKIRKLAQQSLTGNADGGRSSNDEEMETLNQAHWELEQQKEQHANVYTVLNEEIDKIMGDVGEAHEMDRALGITENPHIRIR